MSNQPLQFLLISDFNIDIFRGYLNNDDELPLIEANGAPFGQVIAALVEKNLECWQQRPDYAVVWTQPESVIPSFKSVLSYQSVSVNQILSEVDELSLMLKHLQKRVKYAFIPTWALPSYHRGYGMLEMKNGLGITNILMRMNLRLADNLEEAPNICLLNTQRWIETAGKNAFNPKSWYMAKIAFGNDVFKAAVSDIKAGLNGILGNSRKLILLDLDDTLWGGIVGDDGWENLKLGGHDQVGEAFVDFQKELKALTNRGIVLGIVSKNEETVALEAIDKHPEMVIKREDFAGWRINWNDKAQNIVELVQDLNLGLQSVVFIDDNPVERARVKEALPEVFVPNWPQNKMLYKRALLDLACFDAPSISKEDVERSRMYMIERQREQLKSSVGSVDEWLKTLGIVVKVEQLNNTNLQRTAQLLNKTNQMNLSTRRMSGQELQTWVDQRNHELWTFRVSDKFGDSGLTGILSIEKDGNKAQIVDFVLSCRVFGRKIEETMIYFAIEHVKSEGLDEIYALYNPTPKNQPCLGFWKQSGFTYNQVKNRFIWQIKRPYALPDGIQIECEALNSEQPQHFKYPNPLISAQEV